MTQTQLQPFQISGDYVLTATTTNNTITEMFIKGTGGSNRLTIPSDTTWKFDVQVSARRTDADNESAGYHYGGVIDRNTTVGSTALVGTVQTIMPPQEDNVAWAVTITADTTNGALKVEVTGENAKTISWIAYVKIVEVTG